MTFVQGAVALLRRKKICCRLCKTQLKVPKLNATTLLTLIILELTVLFTTTYVVGIFALILSIASGWGFGAWVVYRSPKILTQYHNNSDD